MAEFLTENRPITSVQDAIDLIDHEDFKEWAKFPDSVHVAAPQYTEPVGVWFRGQARLEWNLVPSVLRPDLYIDESSMTNHFMLRAAPSAEKCRNTFDWLCLMRHFELPTRLLDWSENLLVALYFAVCDNAQDHGALFILNARKLNLAVRATFPALANFIRYRTGHSILVPWSIETAIRAEMSRARSLEHFLELISSFDRDYVASVKSFNAIKDSLQNLDAGVLKSLATPLAVFPNRLDNRMALQQSVFTIHGGKQYRHQTSSTESLPLPKPIGLLEISKGGSPEFLRSARVENKRKIKMQLEYMGIHEGSIFPELDHQAAYIRSKWEFHKTSPVEA